jgi:hypothetical protein
MQPSNHIAGSTPEFVGMMPVCLGHRSGSARGSLGSMRALVSIVLLLTVCGCARSHDTALDPELQRLVGQTATLRGKLELGGKVGPYIDRTGEPVYLVPQGSFGWSSEYQGKVVSITGILHFRHFDRIKTNEFFDRPADYFYFDAETAKIRPE